MCSNIPAAPVYGVYIYPSRYDIPVRVFQIMISSIEDYCSQGSSVKPRVKPSGEAEIIPW